MQLRPNPASPAHHPTGAGASGAGQWRRAYRPVARRQLHLLGQPFDSGVRDEQDRLRRQVGRVSGIRECLQRLRLTSSPCARNRVPAPGAAGSKRDLQPEDRAVDGHVPVELVAPAAVLELLLQGPVAGDCSPGISREGRTRPALAQVKLVRGSVTHFLSNNDASNFFIASSNFLVSASLSCGRSIVIVSLSSVAVSGNGGL